MFIGSSRHEWRITNLIWEIHVCLTIKQQLHDLEVTRSRHQFGSNSALDLVEDWQLENPEEAVLPACSTPMTRVRKILIRLLNLICTTPFIPILRGLSGRFLMLSY